MQIDRNAWGLNVITYFPQKSSEGKTVTIYGRGIIDSIALTILRFLGMFNSDYKPINFKVSYNKNNKFFFPSDMLITQKALKTLFKSHADAWSKEQEISLTEKTIDSIVSRTLQKALNAFEDEGVIFEQCLDYLEFSLTSEIRTRIISMELYISQKLSEIDGDTCEITLPVDRKTGQVIAKESSKSKPYLARVRVKFDETEGRKVELLPEKGGKKPNFSDEALHILTEGINKLRIYVGEPLNMKQIAKKIENDAFGAKFFELNSIPIVDESDKTRVFLNPVGDVVEEYHLANHMELNGKKYIATVYPKADEDWKFWEMIFEQESPVIVKLNDIQKTTKDDASYWPSAGEKIDYSKTGVPITVETKSEVKLSDYLIKREIEIVKEGKSHTVIHIDFLAWPDKSIPNKTHFLRLLSEVNSTYDEILKGWPSKKVIKAEPQEEEAKPQQDAVVTEEKASVVIPSENPAKETDGPSSTEGSLSIELPKAKTSVGRKSGPITVHCSAGVGRTGTFLGIHSSLGEKNPDFIKLLYKMRKQRCDKMVETVDQFQFIKAMHDELCEHSD